MQQTLALIHTSPTLTPVFNALAAKILSEVRVFHMVDESLIKNTIASGGLRKQTIRRLIAMIDSAGAAGADAVLVTCSSIGEGASLARELFDFPVVRIDEAMAENAVQKGKRIGVMATLQTTLQPTLELLRKKASSAAKSVELIDCFCANAFEAVLRGDTATHDRIVGQAVMDLMAKVDLIVLAQASMARVVESLPPEAVTRPVLSSPESAMLHVRAVFRELAQAR